VANGTAVGRMRAFLLILACLALAPSCGRYLEGSLDSVTVAGDAVTFRVKSPYARTVQLAGDWPGNNWAEGDAEAGEVLVGLMTKSPQGGVWEAIVYLKPGRYRYRFLINETQWMLDPQNPRIVDDGRGGKANLLIMP
jgi:1,4-alpha-glucan branching enzyme